MTSKSKDQTEDIPPSFSAENTEDKVQPSEPLANSDNTQISTQTLQKPSRDMLSEGKKGSTTPATTEKTRDHALIAKVAIRQLEMAGLIRRFKVLSADSTTVQKIRIEFDLSWWTEDLDLR